MKFREYLEEGIKEKSYENYFKKFMNELPKGQSDNLKASEGLFMSMVGDGRIKQMEDVKKFVDRYKVIPATKKDTFDI